MSILKPLVTVIKAGFIKYSTGLKIQQTLANQRIDLSSAFRNYLVIQEFEPVYTIGIRTKSYTIDDEKRLRDLGAEFYKTNRGGLITFHGPGQLVAYPIIHLKQFEPSMRWYVHNLEQTVIDSCQNLGIKTACRTKDTGIWIGSNKICAIGVHGSRYITTHGIGLNCTTDLKWFEHIIPCGIEGKGVTSVSNELKKHVTVDEVIPVLCDSFSRLFNCTIYFDNDTELEKIVAKE